MHCFVVDSSVSTVRILSCWVLAIGSVASFGCDSGRLKTYPVRGTVTFPDGEPLPGGRVILLSTDQGGIQARAKITDAGTFVLGTYEKDDGAVAGRHLVGVLPPRDGYDGPPTVPIEKKLTRPSTSGIEVMIEKDDTNVLEVQVEHPKGKKPRSSPGRERFDLGFNFHRFTQR
jgi:hypothetical protein